MIIVTILSAFITIEANSGSFAILTIVCAMATIITDIIGV
jgi:hypothetical protein